MTVVDPGGAGPCVEEDEPCRSSAVLLAEVHERREAQRLATLEDLYPTCPGWGPAEIHFGKHCSMTNKFWSWKWVYERTGTCGWFEIGRAHV